LVQLTLKSAVAPNGNILKCSVPSRSNLHFKFLTFGHSGAKG